jgi:protease IV
LPPAGFFLPGVARKFYYPAMTPTDVERLIDLRKIKRKLTFWRGLVIAGLCVGLVGLLVSLGDYEKRRDHIARIAITGLITGDQATMDMLDAIYKSENVKAIILHVDSPGGTTAGSEAVYESLRDSAAIGKPIVAVMGTVAASGGYITAIAADHIIARGNSITGSIGVIFSFPEFSKLLDTVGIKMEEIKSAPLKAEPSPYKPVSPEARQVTQEMIKDSFDWFVGLVAERRALPLAEATRLADGRVYTGRQALKVKLIDEIGSEFEAVSWLTSQKDVAKELPIIDWAPAPPPNRMGFGFSISQSILSALGLDSLRQRAESASMGGLLVLWQPL